jgi:hypothetical protein
MDAKRKKRIKRNWAAIFKEFHRSRLSITEFCQTNAISPSLFYLRRKDYSNFDISAKPPLRQGNFIELTPSSSVRRSASIIFGSQIELAISNDCDKELVRLLISQLKESSC